MDIRYIFRNQTWALDKYMGIMHLNPSMALGSFSLSLLMQVHEAAAVVESGGDAGDQRDAARRAGGGHV